MPIPGDAPTRPAPASAFASASLEGAPRRATSGWMRWRRVVQALGWRMRTPPASTEATLATARQACIALLADLPPLEVRVLCHLLANANSLAELWHLRPEVYRVLALHHSQAEAERRLALGPLVERRRNAGLQRPPR